MLEEKIRRLFDSNKASHAYLFFGDSQVGKLTFALKLAGYLEFGKFEKNTRLFSETLVIKPIIEETKESIGIEQIRAVKNFLYQSPANSKYRLAIIDDAHYITDIAQNALLKVAEEPPAHGVIIMITPNPDVLMKTLQSRFQKIYFPRLTIDEVQNILIKDFNIPAVKAKEAAAISFGRVGRAVNLLNDEKTADRDKEARDLIAGRVGWRDEAKYLADPENRGKIYPFLENLIARLSTDPVKNFEALKSLSRRMEIMFDTSANKRLQLEAGLYPISKSM